ncbi:MAG: hypothetical protein R3F35_11410 [Myxococcota bacterium]
MLKRFVLRDGVIVAIACLGWALLAPASGGTGWTADLAGWIAGLLATVCAYLAHEWSHYLGALATRSRAPLAEHLASPFLFRFEAETNGLLQFVGMSLAGFAATAIAVWLAYTWLPDALLATRIARGGALFLASLGVVLELPLLVYGLVTGGVPKQVSV